jgi:hypothetical protein
MGTLCDDANSAALNLWYQVETLHRCKRRRRSARQHDSIGSAIGVRGADHSGHSSADSHYRYIEPLARYKLKLAERDSYQPGASADRKYRSIDPSIVGYEQLTDGGNSLPMFIEDRSSNYRPCRPVTIYFLK